MKRNARKLLEATNKLSINVMNEPRQGKKLLVLDLDYTILARPLVIGEHAHLTYFLQDSEAY